MGEIINMTFASLLGLLSILILVIIIAKLLHYLYTWVKGIRF